MPVIKDIVAATLRNRKRRPGGRMVVVSVFTFHFSSPLLVAGGAY